MAKVRPTFNSINKYLASAQPVRVVFIAVIFVMMVIPFVGMLWAPTNETVEKRELASFPQLYDEEAGLNGDFLSQAGDYFSDHYAYRVPLIDVGAHMYATTFGVSTADTVVVGNNGWLYYAGTLNDYQNKQPMRDKQARNIAHNIKMMQDYCEERDATFAFMVAPNKNTLYGQDMPFYYPHVDSVSMSKLETQLDDYEVRYVNLFEPIRAADERLYFYRDSHWTEKGALIAHDVIADQAHFETAGVLVSDLEEKDNYTGDLSEMLYPDSPDPEPNWYATGVNDGSGATGTLRSGSLWAFEEGESVEDSTIRTVPTEESVSPAAQKNGALLMFRDSFGNSLIPYLACEFSSATFSKMLPFNLLLVNDEQPQTVLVERAQRHVDYFAEEAPLMVCPTVEINDQEPLEVLDGDTTCETGQNGPLVQLKGFIKGDRVGDYDEVLVELIDPEGASCVYRAFLLSDKETGSDSGYCVYASKDLWADQDITAVVMVESGDTLRTVGTFDVRFDTNE